MNLLERADAALLFRGTLQLERTADGWMPERLTKRQLAHYAAVDEGRRIRSLCAAGVQLRLRTDSPWLELEFECLGGARSYLGLDVEVNGQCVHSVRLERFEGVFRERLLDFTAEPRAHREIVVHLPCAMVVRLRRVDVADGATVETVAAARRRVLCLGDSITQGMTSISPLSTYTTQLARLLGADLLNQGIGGHVFEAASLDALPTFPPDLITVAYGTNDWTRGTGRAELARNVTAYLDRLQSLFPGVPVHVISPLWRAIAGERKGDGLDLPAFGALIREFAGRRPGVLTVDGLTLVPHQAMYFADGTHPNELGFMHYAANLYLATR